MVKRVVKISQSCLGELLASFIFGFSNCTAFIGTALASQPAVPATVGFTVKLSGVAVIYSHSDETVAHFNSAIAFAAMRNGRIPFVRSIYYVFFPDCWIYTCWSCCKLIVSRIVQR